MGINGFFPFFNIFHATGSKHGNPRGNLEQLRKSLPSRPEKATLSIDVSTLLNAVIRMHEVCCFQAAKWSVSMLAVKIQGWYERKGFRKCISPQLKEQVTRLGRNYCRAKAKAVVDAMLAAANESDNAKLWRVWKKLCTVDDDVIAVILAWASSQDPHWVQVVGLRSRRSRNLLGLS